METLIFRWKQIHCIIHLILKKKNPHFRKSQYSMTKETMISKSIELDNQCCFPVFQLFSFTVSPITGLHGRCGGIVPQPHPQRPAQPDRQLQRRLQQSNAVRVAHHAREVHRRHQLLHVLMERHRVEPVPAGSGTDVRDWDTGQTPAVSPQ